VVAPAVRLVRGASTTVVLRFTVPAGLGGLRIEPSGRIPAIPWQYRDDRWTDEAGHDVEW
jgi:hypothetical protein